MRRISCAGNPGPFDCLPFAIRRHALHCLHREQIRLLADWRREEAEAKLQPLLVTVNALAAGLKTTG